MQPKLSIITINYNNAHGLQKTMESVLNQSSLDFEYIVVDGAAPQIPHPNPLLEEREQESDRKVLEGFIEEKFEAINGFTTCTWLSPSMGIGGGF